MSNSLAYLKNIKVGDHIVELQKSLLPASAAVEIGYYPFFCSSSTVRSTDTFLETKSAILMGTGGIASINLGKEKFAYSTDTWGFRANSTDIETEFLYWMLYQHLEKIDYSGFEGSGLKHLRKDYIRNFKLAIPDKQAAKKINKILEINDKAIGKTEALIEKYQKIKAGLMQDLFTRGVGANGKLRPSQEDSPEMYQKTSLGWIPKEWAVKTCSDLCSRICVGIVIQPTHYYVKDGVPAFRSANIRETGIVSTNLVYISEISNKLLAKSQVKTDDILTVRTGYPGTSAVVPKEYSDSNCIDILISTPTSEISSNYLCSWINSSFGKGQVLRQQGGMAQQHFNVAEMRKLLVAVPSASEQSEISQHLAVCSTKLFSEYKQLKKLRKQKSGLMHDLLTGKVQVKVDA